MKRIFALLLASCVALLAFTACGGNEQPGSDPVSSTDPVSTVDTAPEPAPTADPESTDPAPAEEGHDLDALLATLVEAANLGGTFDMLEMDLKAGGIDMANVADFRGAESLKSMENGGIVVVFTPADGAVDTLVDELVTFRDTRMGNEDYAEFETARLNTADARIVNTDNLVIYAVSATGQDGGWEQLDAAITACIA